MRKKTIIIASAMVYTLILVGILIFRIVMIMRDTSGFFDLTNDSIIFFILNFLPEVAIVLTIFAAHIRRGIGLFLTALGGFVTLCAFGTELFIKIIKSADIINRASVPPAIMPWLNIPVFIIVIILFVFKFHIYNLPAEITFGKKKVQKKRVSLF